MSKKLRAPTEQLREAGKVARQMLVKKGFIAEKSIIDGLLKKKGAPKLPGIPPYIPRPDTIKVTQRVMRDLVIMWKDECVRNPSYKALDRTLTEGKDQNITEFFKFVLASLDEREEKFDKDMKKMKTTYINKVINDVPVIKEIFYPMRNKENLSALHHFFIDSFALSIIIKSNHNTSSYLNWFLDWTEEMYKLWSNYETIKEKK
jgi:hypothetical protein